MTSHTCPDELPRKPFWKRKRWIAAAVLWLVIWYPLSVGPLEYVFARDWISQSAVEWLIPFYWPLVALANSDTPPGDVFSSYAAWWRELGYRHRASP
jgi:hypothetical protein